MLLFGGILGVGDQVKRNMHSQLKKLLLFQSMIKPINNVQHKIPKCLEYIQKSYQTDNINCYVT